MSNVRVVGLLSVVARFSKRKVDTASRVRKVVRDTSQRIFNESQRRVPVDFGNLKGSGRWEPPEGQELSARVSYGGSAAGYALIVHETHAYGGRKYLEEPAREEAGRFKEDVKNAIKGD